MRKTVAILLSLIVTTLAHAGGRYDIVVVGGGTSGTCAAVQSARLGCKVLLIDQTSWLGGMLTSAGVSATDGNYKLPSGMWGDFQDELVHHYGSLQALQTGWVSMIQFEPSVGNQIFQQWVSKEKAITYLPNTQFVSLRKKKKGYQVTFVHDGRKQTVSAAFVIDGTELGDVAKAAGLKYHVGLDAAKDTGEAEALPQAKNMIQDATYVMTLKDYGQPMPLSRPAGYDVMEFRNCCLNPYNDTTCHHKLWSAEMMMSYGRLPHGKYMINWPLNGNDIYMNDIDCTHGQRDSLHQQAKAKALRFLYFLQQELGFQNLNLADDEFPTADRLPFFPYYREGRRFEGMVTFTINDIRFPYQQAKPLYRTAIAVGDYPIDQHHIEKGDTMPLHALPSIPSWGLPMGVLIPREDDHLVLAEKAISVTNLANGTTRLQPVSMQIGQAAGVLASLAVRHQVGLKEVSVREVQQQLLETGNYLLPYLDVPKTSPLFKPLQRIGVTGLLEGEGKSVDWSNVTWLHTDRNLTYRDLCPLAAWYPSVKIPQNDQPMTMGQFVAILCDILHQENQMPEDIVSEIRALLSQYDLGTYNAEQYITRGQMALLTDQLLHPFEKYQVDIYGNLLK